MWLLAVLTWSQHKRGFLIRKFMGVSLRQKTHSLILFAPVGGGQRYRATTSITTVFRYLLYLIPARQAQIFSFCIVISPRTFGLLRLLLLSGIQVLATR